MDDLLFLAHRLPYPPDKGDKIRSWHLLQHFAGTRRVHLGCFVDDPADWVHVDRLRRLCAEVWVGDLSSAGARLRSLHGLVTGAPLSFAHFWSARLARWVRRVRKGHPGAATFAFSSSMAQYLDDPATDAVPRPLQIVDLVDLDSEKWRQYAAEASPPMSWVLQREAVRTAGAEVAIARRADLSLVVSDEEAADLHRRPGVPGDRVHVLANGVDTTFFDPGQRHARPDAYDDGPAIVFTGAMDYRANVDAVRWFAAEVLPLIRARRPRARFFVVGARPAPEVLALRKQHGVQVTGRVSDIRPWLAHADAVVAPLRIARGVQNKVLEAMAMARPVVCSPQALAGLRADPGEHVLVAGEPSAFCEAVVALFDDQVLARRLSSNARALVSNRYRWQTRLAELEALLRAAGERVDLRPRRAVA